METKTGDGPEKVDGHERWWSFAREEQEIWRSFVKEECEIWRSFIKREIPSDLSRAIARNQWHKMVCNIVYFLVVVMITLLAADYIDERIFERHKPKPQQVSTCQQFL